MKFCFIILLLSSVFASKSQAQWVKVYEFANGKDYPSTIYFQDAEGRSSVGFAGILDQSSGKTMIARTSDYGRTWNTVHSSLSMHYICEFCFKDSLTGWCSGLGSPALLFTSDGGLTWNNLPVSSELVTIPDLSWRSSLKLLLGIFHDDVLNVHGIFRSQDLGVTWEQVTNTPVVGFAFDDLKNGIATGIGYVGSNPPRDGISYSTHDDGLNWEVSDGEFEACQPSWNGVDKFVAVSELGNHESSFFWKNVNGIWQETTIDPGSGSPTGTVQTNNCYTYAQCSGPEFVDSGSARDCQVMIVA